MSWVYVLGLWGFCVCKGWGVFKYKILIGVGFLVGKNILYGIVLFLYGEGDCGIL